MGHFPGGETHQAAGHRIRGKRIGAYDGGIQLPGGSRRRAKPLHADVSVNHRQMRPEHAGHIGNRDIQRLVCGPLDRREHVQVHLAPPPETPLHVFHGQRDPRVHVHFHHGKRNHKVVLHYFGTDTQFSDGPAAGHGNRNKGPRIKINEGQFSFTRHGRNAALLKRIHCPDAQNGTFANGHFGAGFQKCVRSGGHGLGTGDNSRPGGGHAARIGFQQHFFASRRGKIKTIEGRADVGIAALPGRHMNRGLR